MWVPYPSSPTALPPKPAVVVRRNRLAVAALVLGISSFVLLGPVGGVLAVVVGSFGLRRARRVGRGRSASLAGVILGVLGTVVSTVVIVALVPNVGSSGGDATSAADTGPSASSASAEPAPAAKGVGDEGTTGDWTVTFNGAMDPYVSPNPFAQPIEGTHFLAVDVSMTNAGSKELMVGALVMYALYDAQGNRFEVVPTDDDLPPVDGTVAPGATARGWTVFQVPDTSTGLVLQVAGDASTTGVRFALP